MSEENKEVENNEEVVQEQAAPEALSLNTLYGFKKGMSAVYNENGDRVPVTVLECKPWTVTQIKTKDKNGYDSVQIGFKSKKAKNSSKSGKADMLKRLNLKLDFNIIKKLDAIRLKVLS